MEDKELIKKIKYSFKAGKSRAEITRTLQTQNYRLEYIDKLISKSKRGKKILITTLTIFFITILILLTTYLMITNQKKANIKNPLNELTNSEENLSLEKITEKSIENIKITPEFLSYLLNELGAWELHKNPFNFEKPIINFEIGNEQFYSIIDKKIKTLRGNNQKADIKFIFTKEDTIKAIISKNPGEYIRKSFIEKKARIETIADDKTLFIKGYLNLYNKLK